MNGKTMPERMAGVEADIAWLKRMNFIQVCLLILTFIAVLSKMGMV